MADVDDAVARATRAARAMWVSNDAFRASVANTRIREPSFRRALHAIERRTVVLRTSPIPAGDTAPLVWLPDPRGHDAWYLDQEALARTSRVTSVCPACGGLHSACQTCHGSGRVRAWLSVVSELFDQVRVIGPTGEPLPPNFAEAEDFFRQTAADVEIVADTMVDEHDLPIELRPLLTPAERVRSSRLQELTRAVVEVEYETALGDGAVGIVGASTVMQFGNGWQPLEERIRSVIAIVGLTLALGISLITVYIAGPEHPHLSLVNGALMIGLALLVSFAIGVSKAELSLTRSARDPRRLGLATGIAVAGMLGFATIWLAPPFEVELSPFGHVLSIEPVYSIGWEAAELEPWPSTTSAAIAHARDRAHLPNGFGCVPLGLSRKVTDSL